MPMKIASRKKEKPSIAKPRPKTLPKLATLLGTTRDQFYEANYDAYAYARYVVYYLQEQGKLTHVALAPGEDIGRWIDEFLRLEASGWKGKEGSAMICSEANRRFLTETFTAAYKRGRLEMVGIDLDGKPLDFSTGRSLTNNRGVIATNGKLHDAALAALNRIGA